MKLVPHWKAVMWRSYAARALAAIAGLQIALAALPADALAAPVPFTGHTWGQVLVACSVIAAIGGWLLRPVAQTSIPKEPADGPPPVA